MIEERKWVFCPCCGAKTRLQLVRQTELRSFPLFCPKCRYSCVIGFHDGKIEEIKMPDA